MLTTPHIQITHQLALALKLNDEATLKEFCWGNNTVLQQQILSTLSGNSDRLIYLWGSIGSGKSHLLQACCQSISSDQSSIYLPLKLLKDCGINVIDGVDTQNWIWIDDIDSIATIADWEEALFHLYNRVRDREKSTLIMTGQLPPNQLAFKLADLQSRLSWGLVMHLQDLNDEDKISTLKLQAQKRGFLLPTRVGQFLLNRCSRNMHDLHAILNQLDDASLMTKRRITIPFVKDILNL